MRRVDAHLVGLFVLTLVSHAFAWNGEGHQVVAWIAEERLTPAAEKQVAGLLGSDAHLSDGDVASWADEIRRDRPETGPLHFVNIPVDAKGYDATRDGNHGDNVIDAITKYQTALADKSRPKKERVEALKFLVHFVGDAHQPLHCAERGDDAGGNAVKVTLPASTFDKNLHQVWDTDILRSVKGKLSVAEYGGKLNDAINPRQAKSWAKGTPLTWALESWKIARDFAYKSVPRQTEPVAISQTYIDAAAPIVNERLARAGVRLADLLNAALK